MTEFLGIPMTLIMIVLLVVLAVSVASVALVWVRNPILFDIGIRNIPRRRAQSLLIVLGLMLSTVIIAAAFSIGDTVNYSITNDTYGKLGRVDELVQVKANTASQSLTDEQITPPGIVPQAVVDGLIADFNGVDDVDGILAGLRFPAPATHDFGNPNDQNALNEPQVVVIGLDQKHLSGFEQDIVTTAGVPFNVGQLKRSEALANASLADALQLKVGDRVNVWVAKLPRSVTIVGIVQDRFLTGWTRNEPDGLLVSLDTAQFLFAQVARVNGVGFVAVSNRGEVRDSVALTDTVQKAARKSINSGRIEVSAIKRDRIERAKEMGSNMAAIFVVLGLFSIMAGMLLIFLILVMLAAERRPEMGMVRAVGMKRQQLIESFMAEGLAYSVTSAAAGALLGVAVSVGMTRAMAYIFNRFEVGIAFHVTWRSLVVAYSLGVVLTFITVTISAWRVSKLSIVAAIREVTEPAPRATGLLSGLAGVAMLAGGAGITGWGLTSDTAWAFGTGVSLMLIGAAFVARALGRPERLVFTVTSLAVLVLWVLVAGDSLHAVTGRLEVGLETFFVGGVLMVAAATFALVYNAELLLGSLRGIGVLFARSVPAVRASIAYPLANKFRTGMTIAMMSLVVFALVMISTMNMNFQRLFLSTDSRGGWDIEVEALLTNAIAAGDGENRLGPLGEALDRKFYATKNIESVSQVSIANERSMQIAQLDKDGKALEAKPFRVVGADDTFLNENTIGLQARAQGFNSDRQVWDAVRKDPSNAVIDGSVVPGINYANVTETRFTLAGYKSGTKSFSMFPMQITSTAGNKLKTVRIIGIMNRGPSETYGGLWINRKSSDDAFPPLLSRYYIRLKPGLDAAAEAAKIEKALAQNGVSAHSIEKQVQKEQALSSAFFYLMQGFMGLGLGVGLAALAVIAFRTVVERRQQIGLMRAIGFSRMNVALTFVLESAFIALLGIANGIWLALVLANRLLSSDQFATAGFTTFYVPWLQIMLMAVLVFVASVLTTLIPSRQASGIPPAEALRYE